MGQKFNNNARARLASGIGTSDTSIVVEGGFGDLFPVANMGTGTTGDWFKATLELDTGDREIVKVRTRANGSDVLSNVVRAQEGTTALVCPTGTVIGLRFTAGDLQSVLTAIEALDAENDFQTTAPSCANTGPDGSADKRLVYKSVIGEYWKWLGDAWVVIANSYASFTGTPSIALVANTETFITSIIVPRNGTVNVRGIVSSLNQTGTRTVVLANIRRVRIAGSTTILDSLATVETNVASQYSQVRPLTRIDVQAGDTLQLIATATQNMSAAPTSDSSIHFEYVN